MTDPYVWYPNANMTVVFVDGKWQTINMAYIHTGPSWVMETHLLNMADLGIPEYHGIAPF